MEKNSCLNNLIIFSVFYLIHCLHSICR